MIGGNTTGGGSPQYAFVAAFDPAGSQLLYSTIFGDLNGFKCANGCGSYLGHRGRRGCQRLLLPGRRNQAGKLPTTVGVVSAQRRSSRQQWSYVLASRGFIAKFNPVTSAGGVLLAYCHLPWRENGNTSDYISGIAIDSASNAYVVGYTNSKDFPVTSGAYGTVCGPDGRTCAAAHVTKLNPTGTAILWSTYVGDAKSDGSDALYFTGPIQLDGKGNIYIMGQVGTSFPNGQSRGANPNRRGHGGGRRRA